MSKILADNIIPDLKSKIGGGEGDNTLKVYAVAPTEDGVFNIVDSSLPSTPVEGMQFILRPTANTPSGTVPKISVNSSTPLGVNRQHINANNPARVEMGSMNSGNHYWIVWANDYWRCLNSPTTVSAADADVTSIMNSAGGNRQLFGLGGECIGISNTDLNNLQAKTGFYVGENLTNGPTAQIGEWY